MNPIYYNKYLKYKIKYIKLQELIGGVVEIKDFLHKISFFHHRHKKILIETAYLHPCRKEIRW